MAGGFLSNLELAWDDPTLRVVLLSAASRIRLILYDRRGTVCRVEEVPPPDLETRVTDLRVILDEVGSMRPVLAGIGESGTHNVLFAASNPERVNALSWWYPSARMLWSPDYPWA